MEIHRSLSLVQVIPGMKMHSVLMRINTREASVLISPTMRM